MRPRAAVASVQGTVSVGRIDSSQWNGIVTPLLGYQRFQRSSKLASNVWRAARIGDGVIERDGERGDFCWLQGTRKLGVTPRKRILPINCQSNLATQKILLFVVTTRLRLSITLFLPCYRPFSASDNLLPRFLLFFFLSSTRVANTSSEILGSWEGRCLPFLGEGGRFYFPEKSGQILENNIGEEVLKIVCTYVYI